MMIRELKVVIPKRKEKAAVKSSGREIARVGRGVARGGKGPNKGGRLADRGSRGDKRRTGSSSTHTHTNICWSFTIFKLVQLIYKLCNY
jgi:hypothetical protein